MLKNSIHQKALSILLAFSMVLSVFRFAGVSAFAEETKNSAMLLSTLQNSSRTVLSLDDGSIVFGSGGVTVNGAAVTANPCGYIITQKDSGAAALSSTVSVTGGTQNITLQNVNIDVSGTSFACAFSIAAGAAVNLTLDGKNTLKSGEHCAGLNVPANAALTVTGESAGSLNVTGGNFGAGIGGSNGDGGSIEISGGTVTATGGTQGAGIGGGIGNGGSIEISGGTVTATGDQNGAGIGGGGEGSIGGEIAISGGSVTAQGGGSGAGIGGGYRGNGGIIQISGGTITAQGDGYGAGIGGGLSGNGGNITISGGTVTAQGGGSGAGIGGGHNGDGGSITISGGTVTAKGGPESAGIGSDFGDGGTIEISGGTVTAQGGIYGAGIGGGCKKSNSGAVTIQGQDTEVTARGQGDGKSIGSGAGSTGDSLAVSDGATVIMTNTDAAAPVGSPMYSGCRIITRSGGSQTETVYDDSGNRLDQHPSVITAVLTAEPAADGGVRLTAKAGNSGNPVKTGEFTFEYSHDVKDSGTIEDNVSIDADGTASCTWDAPTAQGLTVVTAKYKDASNQYDALKTLFYYSPDPIDLSTVSSDRDGCSYSNNTITLTRNGWYVFTGSTTANKILAPNGVSACVTLKDASINVGTCAFSIAAGAAVNLTLEGENTLTSGANCAGLNVKANAALTITEESTGLLNATAGHKDAGDGGAGIGSGYGEKSGSITIKGGTVTATGGWGGAGIGGGNGEYSSIGTITILGGTVTATSGKGFPGSGIGGGAINGSGGTITISGGTVKATGGLSGGTGIGGGHYVIGKTTIVINGGTVIATGGGYSGTIYGGSGIGTGATFGDENDCSISISGVNTEVHAKGNNGGYDIGSGVQTTKSSNRRVGSLAIGEANVPGGPTVEMQSAGTDTSCIFKNCTVKGDGAKDKSSKDISGEYDTDGHIKLSVALEANPALQTTFGNSVALSAILKKYSSNLNYSFGGTDSPNGKVLFTCDGSTIKNSIAVENWTAATVWTPLDAQTHTLKAQYMRSDSSDSYAAAADSISYDVKKITPTVKTAPTASNIVYGSALSSSILSNGTMLNASGKTVPGSFAWETPSAIVTASGNYTVVFTPGDITHYNTVTGIPVPVTVAAASDGNSNSSSGTNSKPSLPSTLTDTPTGLTADLSGASFPSWITKITVSATRVTQDSADDPQAAKLFRVIGSEAKADVIGTPILYNIKLLDQNGSAITGFNGTVKVKLPVPAGLRGTPHVFRYEESTGTFTDMNARLENGFLVFSTDHFSYYAFAGVGDSITLDTTSYRMPINGKYQIGVKLTGSKASTVKVHSTNDKTAAVSKLTNGNYQVTGKGTGTAWIMFDVYDNKNRLLTHASVRISVVKGAKPFGSSARQIGLF